MLLCSSCVSRSQVETSILKLQELLDNPFILKNMIYMLIDTLLIELFPQLTDKLPGMDAIA